MKTTIKILVLSTFKSGEKDFYKGEIETVDKTVLEGIDISAYREVTTNIPMFEKCLYELDNMFKDVPEDKYNDIARYVSIVKRSVENLDTFLGLFDLSEEENFNNGTQLAETVLDHILFKYNVKQPGSAMIDYEITMVQSYMKKIYDTLFKNGGTQFLDQKIKDTRVRTQEIIAEVRVEIKKQQAKEKEEQEKSVREMGKKQAMLDAENQTLKPIEGDVSQEDIDSL